QEGLRLIDVALLAGKRGEIGQRKGDEKGIARLAHRLNDLFEEETSLRVVTASLRVRARIVQQRDESLRCPKLPHQDHGLSSQGSRARTLALDSERPGEVIEGPRHAPPIPEFL